MCNVLAPFYLFLQVNWDTALANIEVTFGGPQAPRRPRRMKSSKVVAFDSPIFGNWVCLKIGYIPDEIAI